MYIVNVIDILIQIDRALEDAAHDRQEFSKEAALAEIRKNTLENLGNSSQVYLISVREGRYDFPELMSGMMKSLPDIKKEVIMRIIKSNNKNILQQKRAILEKKVRNYFLILFILRFTG